MLQAKQAPLHYAVGRNGNAKDLVSLLLEKGADTEARSKVIPSLINMTSSLVRSA